MTYKIFLREELWMDQVQLVIFKEENGKRYIAKPLEFEIAERNVTIGQPTAYFPRHDNVPQQLKKELQNMGLIDNADAATVAALKYHLEDMRTLALKPRSRK